MEKKELKYDRRSQVFLKTFTENGRRYEIIVRKIQGKDNYYVLITEQKIMEHGKFSPVHKIRIYLETLDLFMDEFLSAASTIKKLMQGSNNKKKE